ncbi:MAG: CRISPR-associated endonuclease Cas2 [Pseudomonadota bacterium]
MPVNEQRDHIIAYDIGEPRRLGRIHRYLKKRAMPIQYSVFLIRCNAEQLHGIIQELDDMIDPERDDIRFYTLPRKPQVITLGQQGMPEGLQLLSGTGNDYEKML